MPTVAPATVGFFFAYKKSLFTHNNVRRDFFVNMYELLVLSTNNQSCSNRTSKAECAFYKVVPVKGVGEHLRVEDRKKAVHGEEQKQPAYYVAKLSFALGNKKACCENNKTSASNGKNDAFNKENRLNLLINKLDEKT